MGWSMGFENLGMADTYVRRDHRRVLSKASVQRASDLVSSCSYFCAQHFGPADLFAA